MPAPFDFNEYQASAVQSYGTGQGAVDFILQQRYGGESFGALPSDFPERYSGGWWGDRDMPRPTSYEHAPPSAGSPSLFELRYRGL